MSNQTEIDYIKCYEWIASCETKFQFETAGAIIDLFKNKYPNEKNKKGLLLDLLTDKIMEKYPPTNEMPIA